MRTTLAALALAGTLSAHASASPFGYSYFGLSPLGSADVEVDDADHRLSAGVLDIQLDVFDTGLFVFVSHDAVSGQVRIDRGEFDYTRDIGFLGAGYHHTLNPRLDLFASAAVLTGEATLSNACGTQRCEDDGFELRVGVRYLMTPKLEGTVHVGQRSWETWDDETVTTAGLRYEMWERWRVIGDVAAGGGDTVVTVGVRFHFLR